MSRGCHDDVVVFSSLMAVVVVVVVVVGVAMVFLLHNWLEGSVSVRTSQCCQSGCTWILRRLHVANAAGSGRTVSCSIPFEILTQAEKLLGFLEPLCLVTL